jgi:TonB family protein
MPTTTLPLTAGADNGSATLAAAGPSQGFSPGDYLADSFGERSVTTVPISSLTRTNYVAPVYPRAAQRRSLTGSVDIMFTVSTIGTVTDVSVVSAEPDDTFNKAAIDAVSKWRFEPVIENGVALEKRSAVRLSFDLQ